MPRTARKVRAFSTRSRSGNRPEHVGKGVVAQQCHVSQAGLTGLRNEVQKSVVSGTACLSDRLPGDQLDFDTLLVEQRGSLEGRLPCPDDTDTPPAELRNYLHTPSCATPAVRSDRSTSGTWAKGTTPVATTRVGPGSVRGLRSQAGSPPRCAGVK